MSSVATVAWGVTQPLTTTCYVGNRQRKSGYVVSVSWLEQFAWGVSCSVISDIACAGDHICGADFDMVTARLLFQSLAGGRHLTSSDKCGHWKLLRLDECWG
ncbi:hypothetical protein DL546_002382 [Coniochaeta pulveracea]|uniref:Uncharacterized protein n=1 Tax=Coniochaeta pulveracea TaxID=177199 RepID=A0A420Y8T6_9PEZI|nr:hypothetical protein DL546_002382 [Coniochaeta pulveracea]